MKNKKIPWVLLLTVLSIVASVLIGFVLFRKTQMESWYQQYAFYFLLATFGIWIQRILPATFEIDSIRKTAKKHYVAFFLSALIMILGVFASKPDFRILADETNLLGISMAMYDEHKCYNPTQVIYRYHGIKSTLSKVTDMRPGFYPFLVYIAHSILGYSPNNGFVVNALAGFGCLFFLYILFSRWFGRFYGVTAILLLSSYPLFIMYSTSSGFEIVNLLFAILAFILFDSFLKNKTAVNAERLFLILPLLAQTRYESALAVFCFAPFVLYILPSEQYLKLSIRSILVPLMFIPVAWLRIITYTKSAFQVSNMNDAFGLKLFIKNLKSAITFFSGHNRAFGIVPIITLLAISGFIWMIYDLITKSRKDGNYPYPLVVVSLLFIITHASARFFYYWGNMTLQYTSRLGLIFLPFFVFACLYFLKKTVDILFVSKGFIIVGAVLLIFYSWPVAGQNIAVREIFFYREFKTVRTYLAHHFPDKENYIIVSDLSNLYVPLRYSAVTCGYLDTRSRELLSYLENKQYEKIIVIQKINRVTKKAEQGSVLVNKFNMKTLFEYRLHGDVYLRISEISAFK